MGWAEYHPITNYPVKVWTTERIAQLAAMHDAGLGFPHISRVFGCTSNAVRVAHQRHVVGTRKHGTRRDLA